MTPNRKKGNSSKTNLLVSVVFHGVLVIVVFVLAAKTGLIPKKYIPISLIKPEEKKPEPPKPEEPKPEPPKEPPKVDEAPKVDVPQPKIDNTPPEVVSGAPAAAPSASIESGFQFDGGKAVADMGSSPGALYKGLLEYTLRSNWKRPEDVDDEKFVAEAEVSVDSKGNIKGYRLLSGSGNAAWDNSVKDVLAKTKSVGKPPPKGFPEKVITRFDVISMQGETIQFVQ